MKIKKLLFLVLGLYLSGHVYSQTFDIYVSDAAGFGPPNAIIKYDANGENPETFIGEDELNWPQEILFLEDQNEVLISNLGSGRITRHNASTGDYIDDFATVAGGPTRMAIGPGDFIYVIQWGGNGNVLRFQQDGTFEDEFTSEGVFRSIGIDWDSSGNMYVASYAQSTIRKYNSSGIDQGLFIDSGLAGPTTIRFNDNDELIILNWNTGALQLYDINGALLETFDTGISQAEGIAFYPDGSFLVGHGLDSSVKLYDNNNDFVEEIVASELGGLVRPNAVTLRDQSLSIGEQDNLISNRIFNTSIGNQFQINSNLLLSKIPIKIYDYTGKLVVSIDHMENSIWDANKLNTGLYFATVNFNGQVISQKIVID